MSSQEAVYIKPYDPMWPKKFEKEKKLIEQTIGPWITGGVNHVGSTAIPGLSAKPIIDIMVGVYSLEETEICISMLAKIGYLYYPYRPEYMHWFLKPKPQHRTHHLYLIATSHPQYRARLAFRDYLCTHKEEREQYKQLKIDLAEKFKDDREAYTEAKTQFVKDIVAKALGRDFPFE